MNASGAALLMNPHPCGHIVYPYTEESLVGQAVCLFTSAGLRDGEGVILIMSEAHCESIKVRLAIEGFDTEEYNRSGQLICVTAEDLLEKFVVHGAIDEGLFKSTIGGLIEEARRNVSMGDGRQRRVRLFGEMVSQLRNANLAATTRLEELWNEIIHHHSVALLCTYSMSDQDDHIPEKLIGLHSHNLEREALQPMTSVANS